MRPHTTPSPVLKDLINKLDKDCYFSNLNEASKSFMLAVPHNKVQLSDLDFDLLKIRVSFYHPFVRWGNKALCNVVDSRIVRRLLVIYIAGLSVSIIQETEASTAVSGRSVRTYSFGTDSGDLTDAANEWLRLGHKLTGYKPGIKVMYREIR